MVDKISPLVAVSVSSERMVVWLEYRLAVEPESLDVVVCTIKSPILVSFMSPEAVVVLEDTVVDEKSSLAVLSTSSEGVAVGLE